MNEKRPLSHKMHYTKLRMEAKIRKPIDSLRYSHATSKETQQTIQENAKQFTTDFTQFLSDTKFDQVTTLKLQPIQSVALQQYILEAKESEIRMKFQPSYDSVRKVPILSGSTSSTEPHQKLRASLATSYQTDGSPILLHIPFLVSTIDGNFVNPIVYYAFSQNPKSQEDLEDILKRKDCAFYGSRIDIVNEKLNKPITFLHCGEFNSNDGQDYTVYGWNGDTANIVRSVKATEIEPNKSLNLHPEPFS